MLKKLALLGMAGLMAAGVSLGAATAPAVAAPYGWNYHHHHRHHQVCRIIWRHHHAHRVCWWN